MIHSLNNSYGSRFNYQTQNRPPKQDPDTYAKEYAAKNSISFEDAKAELKAKYGDPEKPQQQNKTQSVSAYKTQKEDKLVSADFSYPSFSSNLNEILPPPNVDPDTYAKEYATKNGISFEDAKAELSAKYGDPVKPQQQAEKNTDKDNSDELPPEAQGLADLGVPLDVIQEGDDAIMNFLKDNNITNYEDKKQDNPFASSKDDNKNKVNLEAYGLPPEAQGLVDLGVPLDVIQEGDDAIMNFLKDNNITNYEDKKAESVSKNNETEDGTFDLSPEAYELIKIGVPLDVIQEGDDAIANFLKDNGLEEYMTK